MTRLRPILALTLALLLGLLTGLSASPDRSLRWEDLGGVVLLKRAQVKGGWLVVLERDRHGTPKYSSLVYIPDPKHEWSGGSPP